MIVTFFLFNESLLKSMIVTFHSITDGQWSPWSLQSFCAPCGAGVGGGNQSRKIFFIDFINLIMADKNVGCIAPRRGRRGRLGGGMTRTPIPPTELLIPMQIKHFKFNCSG
jgi:hypothetical protein